MKSFICHYFITIIKHMFKLRRPLLSTISLSDKYEGISMTKFNNLKVKRVKSNLKHTESKLVKKRTTLKGRNTKKATIIEFFFCDFFVWFCSLSGPKNLSFGSFSLKWLQISLGSFSKNRLDTYSFTPCKFQKCFQMRLKTMKYNLQHNKIYI